MDRFEVAVIGRGGREHELAMQLERDMDQVYCLSGNAGTEMLARGQNVPINSSEIDKIVSFVSEKELGYVVVGPEAPLVAGLGDRLRAKGVKVFGPDAAGARIEGSKAHAEEIMEELGLPRPPTEPTHSYEEAEKIISDREEGTYVIRADGLADGKGVDVSETLQSGKEFLKKLFIDEAFGGAGKETTLIAERWHGPEVTASVLTDGKRTLMLPFSQDHKRLLDGDKGPNTGGMGAYAPLPLEIISEDQIDKMSAIAERLIDGLRHKGIDYRGLVNINFVMAEELGGDPAIYEFNCRAGDPEAQVIFPVLAASGVHVPDLLRGAADGNLSGILIPSKFGKVALTVCLATRGYPDNPEVGQLIWGLTGDYKDVIIHHAGTKNDRGLFKTSSGRAVNVTGLENSIEIAAQRSYDAIGYMGKIGFAGNQYRKDIGHQARTKV